MCPLYATETIHSVVLYINWFIPLCLPVWESMFTLKRAHYGASKAANPRAHNDAIMNYDDKVTSDRELWEHRGWETRHDEPRAGSNPVPYLSFMSCPPLYKSLKAYVVFMTLNSKSDALIIVFVAWYHNRKQDGVVKQRGWFLWFSPLLNEVKRSPSSLTARRVSPADKKSCGIIPIDSRWYFRL